MRTVVFLGLMVIATSIGSLPGADVDLPYSLTSFFGIVLIVSIAMDVVDFFRGK
jgi:hypothetical protein